MTSSVKLCAALAVAGTLGVLGAPAGAQAATVSYQGDTLVLTAKPGERNQMIVGRSDLYDDTIKIGDDYGIDHPGGPSCVDGGNGWLHCAAPAAVRVDLGDGDDTFSFASDEALYGPVTVSGGAGGDVLRGTNVAAGAVTLGGGAGNDTIDGKAADETLLGGDGNDTLSGRGGADVLRGEGGDEALDGDV